MPPSSWPPWWDWDLELNLHVLVRMLDRRFTETDLREMLQDASELRPAAEPGRWRISTRRGTRRWVVIVEPDSMTRTVVIITAYPLD